MIPYKSKVIDWTAVVSNLARANTVWGRMLRILIRDRATPWLFGFFFEAVIQGSTTLRSGDLGGHPLHGNGPGGVSDPGDKTADGTAPAEDNGRNVEIHLGGGGKGGGGFLDDGGIRQAAPEHGHTVYRYAITVRPV